jgi:ribonuclease D
LTKEQINQLPLSSFPGKIHLIDTLGKVQGAVRILKRKSVLGLDTESRPSFKKGQRFPIALIQVAAEAEVFLYQVSRIGIPAELKSLLQNPRVTKIVQGADQELVDLARDHRVYGRGFFDLLPEAKRLKCSPQGVRGMAAIFLGFRISKSAQRSNWGQQRLTDRQTKYAATDAWVCLRIFQQMKLRGFLPQPLKLIDYHAVTAAQRHPSAGHDGPR